MLAASIALDAVPLGQESTVGHLEAHAVCVNAEVGYGCFIAKVIGDFPEEETRRFASIRWPEPARAVT